MSTPSIVLSEGTGTFAKPANVGRISVLMAGSDTTEPATSCPGQRINAGTRIPPSNCVLLPPARTPALPPSIPYSSHGPLSEMNMTSVSLSIPNSTSLARTRPTPSSRLFSIPA